MGRSKSKPRHRASAAAVAGILATALATSTPVPAAAQSGASTLGTAERPPQFVMLAFDGSKSLEFWQESRDFARENDIRFTYFISGVYFIGKENRKLYLPPAGISPGRSDIGVGDDATDIESRIRQVRAAIDEGHEMASHANGHFDGQKWDKASWTQELEQFRGLLLGVFANNKIPWQLSDISAWQRAIAQAWRGFRAPLLGTSDGLWQTLAEQGYVYDTSRVAGPTYWPKVNADGLWNFPLATLKVAGTCKTTLSMDFNFYYAQSQGKDDLMNTALYEEQMFKTYMDYFASNYYGNRAPVHIGHHFSQWNGGAYWRAMKRFAKAVCGLPEVRCGTYSELASFMDAQDPASVARWQRGRFTKYDARPVLVSRETAPSCDVHIGMAKSPESELIVSLQGPDRADLVNRNGARMRFEVNGRPIKPETPPLVIPGSSYRLDLSNHVEKGRAFNVSAVLTDRSGRELMRSTRRIVPRPEMQSSAAESDADYDISLIDLDEAARLQADPPAAHAEESGHGHAH